MHADTHNTPATHTHKHTRHAHQPHTYQPQTRTQCDGLSFRPWVDWLAATPCPDLLLQIQRFQEVSQFLLARQPPRSVTGCTTSPRCSLFSWYTLYQPWNDTTTKTIFINWDCCNTSGFWLWALEPGAVRSDLQWILPGPSLSDGWAGRDQSRGL